MADDVAVSVSRVHLASADAAATESLQQHEADLSAVPASGEGGEDPHHMRMPPSPLLSVLTPSEARHNPTWQDDTPEPPSAAPAAASGGNSGGAFSPLAVSPVAATSGGDPRHKWTEIETPAPRTKQSGSAKKSVTFASTVRSAFSGRRSKRGDTTSGAGGASPAATSPVAPFDTPRVNPTAAMKQRFGRTIKALVDILKDSRRGHATSEVSVQDKVERLDRLLSELDEAKATQPGVLDILHSHVVELLVHALNDGAPSLAQPTLAWLKALSHKDAPRLAVAMLPHVVVKAATSNTRAWSMQCVLALVGGSASQLMSSALVAVISSEKRLYPRLALCEAMAAYIEATAADPAVDSIDEPCLDALATLLKDYAVRPKAFEAYTALRVGWPDLADVFDKRADLPKAIMNKLRTLGAA